MAKSKRKRKNDEFTYPEDTYGGAVERLSFQINDLRQNIIDEYFGGHEAFLNFVVGLARLINWFNDKLGSEPIEGE